MDTNSFPTPFIVTVFRDATAFNRTWCSLSWVGKISAADFDGSNGRMHCCASGKYYDDPDCKDCQIGQYAEQLSLDTSCTTCARDSITPITGLPGCSNCTTGKFSTVKRDECQKCGAGEFTFRGTTESECKECTPGTYQEDGGLESCTSCPTGWYQEFSRKPFCLPCLPGQYQMEEGETSVSCCLYFDLICFISTNIVSSF